MADRRRHNLAVRWITMKGAGELVSFHRYLVAHLLGLKFQVINGLLNPFG